MKTLTEQYIIKSRTGVYQDTSENRRKHRVGQHYGEAKKEGEEGKPSKREQREARLASYKDSLKKLEDRLKEGGLSDSVREKIEGLRDTLKGKITKLEAKLSRGGKHLDEKPEASPKKKAATTVKAPKPQFKKEGNVRRMESFKKGDPIVYPKKDGEKTIINLGEDRQAVITVNPDYRLTRYGINNLYDISIVAGGKEIASRKVVQAVSSSREFIESYLDGKEEKRLEGLGKETGSVSWDKQEAFFKKGTDEYKLLDDWEHFSKRRDPFYQKEMQKTLEKKFPNIDEWRLTSPNTGVSRITAVAGGKEVASIDLANDYNGKSIPALQTFMDKCNKVEKTNKKPEEKPKKVPKGHRIHYEDDLVEVYNDKGKEVYHGILDYCPYKDENYKWNETDQNYDLPQGYKMVGKTKH